MKRSMKLQSGVYWNNAEARTTTYFIPTAQSDLMKFIIHADKFVIYTNNYKASVLPLARGFGLVTPDPFSLRELGGVWARDYSL